VFEAFTKSAMGGKVALANVRREPLAESSVEGGVFGFGNGAGFFDEVGIGAERDVLHKEQCTRDRAHCPVRTIAEVTSILFEARAAIAGWRVEKRQAGQADQGPPLQGLEGD